MCGALKAFLVYVRLLLDKAIDYLFSLYWEGKRTPIPDLDRRHAFLAESTLDLANKIKQGELKSEDLVRAVIDRINQVNPALNAVVAERFEAALAEARQVDAQLAAGLGREELHDKPLLGVPFTTKESQAARGFPLTLGLRTRRGRTAAADCEAVARLKRAGAILVAATNLPELLVWFETHNPVYGLTRNPHHTGRTAGGSSGAEAALAACCATPISLCSDLGGSTRMPAFYCGLFGHHPTPGNTNTKGVFLRTGEEQSMLSLGFVARRARDLAPLLAVLAADRAPRLQLDRPVNLKDIKFYYTESADDCHVSTIRPELRDVMTRVVSAVGGARPYQHAALRHMYSLWRHWMTREPEDVATHCSGGAGPPNVYLELVKKFLFMSDYGWSVLFRLVDLKILPRVNAEWAEKLTRELKEDLFSTLGADGVLLFPSAPHAAPYHYSGYLRPYNFAYWAIVNVLKCPATQVPVGRSAQGLPLGLQVVAAPHNDALCLAVAEHLEKEFGGAVPPCQLEQ